MRNIGALMLYALANQSFWTKLHGNMIVILTASNIVNGKHLRKNHFKQVSADERKILCYFSRHIKDTNSLISFIA